MREWGQFTQEAIERFEQTLQTLLQFVDTAVQGENVARKLAAGFVYFNGGVDKDGRAILALPCPPEGTQMSEGDWVRVVTYITDGFGRQ